MNYFEYLGIKIYLSDFTPVKWLLWPGNEFWKEVPGYEDKYIVSTWGKVKNKGWNRLLKPFDRQPNTPRYGYMSVQLARIENGRRFINFSVHSLVLLTFKGERPEGLVIHHKNHKRGDNRVQNLKYCTQSENRQQDFIDGTQSFLGSKNNQSIITEKDILPILHLRKIKKLKLREIGEIYGLTISGISSILNGRTWSHISGINQLKK